MVVIVRGIFQIPPYRRRVEDLFFKLKLEGHAFFEWESNIKAFSLEGDPLVTKWDDFNTIIKSQCFRMGYVGEQFMSSLL